MQEKEKITIEKDYYEFLRTLAMEAIELRKEVKFLIHELATQIEKMAEEED